VAAGVAQLEPRQPALVSIGDGVPAEEPPCPVVRPLPQVVRQGFVIEDRLELGREFGGPVVVEASVAKCLVMLRNIVGQDDGNPLVPRIAMRMAGWYPIRASARLASARSATPSPVAPSIVED